MLLRLGLKIGIHLRHFLYEYLPAGRIEQETGDELLKEDGDYLLWEGLDEVVIGVRLAQEDGFNFLQETGDYILHNGTVPQKIELYQETGFNLLQEDGYTILVDSLA